MKHAYFVVEGPHDVEVVGRLLGERGYRRRRDFAGLDPYWGRLVPRTFPIDGDLLRRVPVPVFFDTMDWSVAVHSAIGVHAVGKTVRTSLLALGPLDGLGVVIDADYEVSARQRWEALRATIPVDDCGEAPGIVGTGSPRAGIFVLPDNARAGTLEDVLLACAEKTYPKLLGSVRLLVDGLDLRDGETFRDKADRSDFEKPSGRAKAIVGCVGSVLRPGKSIQVSIQDNRWLRDAEALALAEVNALRGFVEALTS